MNREECIYCNDETCVGCPLRLIDLELENEMWNKENEIARFNNDFI